MRVLVVAQLAQDLRGVLAKHRRRALDRARASPRTRSARRRCASADARVLDHRRHSHRLDLRIVEERLAVLHRRAGHAGFDQQVDPVLRRLRAQQAARGSRRARPRASRDRRSSHSADRWRARGGRCPRTRAPRTCRCRSRGRRGRRRSRTCGTGRSRARPPRRTRAPGRRTPTAPTSPPGAATSRRAGPGRSGRGGRAPRWSRARPACRPDSRTPPPSRCAAARRRGARWRWPRPTSTAAADRNRADRGTGRGSRTRSTTRRSRRGLSAESVGQSTPSRAAIPGPHVLDHDVGARASA